MKTVKTITQHGCTYFVNQFGNCSFRIAYRLGTEQTKHIDHVFASIAECEEYISSISGSDALIAQITEKLCAAKEVH